MSRQLKTNGVVLREVKTGPADRILTILTPGHGVISAIAKGAQRLKNKLFAGTGPFCYSEFLLFEGKNLYQVDEATPLEVFFELRSSVEGMALATYLAELMGRLAPEGEESRRQLRLLLNSLALICKGRKPLLQVKLVCELRALSLAGYMPDLVACAGCGCYEGGAFYLDLSDGGLLCAECAQKSGRAPNLTGPQLAAMRHILYSEDEKVFGFSLSPQPLGQLSRLCTEYVTCQLDYRFRSLDFLQSVLSC